MVIYEVHLKVEPERAEAFRVWLDHHIEEMIAIDGFIGAEVLEPFELDSPAEGPSVEFVTQYRLRDRQSLERYLAEHAASMRQDGIDRFGGHFTAERRLFRSARQVAR